MDGPAGGLWRPAGVAGGGTGYAAALGGGGSGPPGSLPSGHGGGANPGVARDPAVDGAGGISPSAKMQTGGSGSTVFFVGSGLSCRCSAVRALEMARHMEQA